MSTESDIKTQELEKLKEQLKQKDIELKQKDIELKQKYIELKQKEEELNLFKEKTYEEVDKNGRIYVMKTDAFNAYKIGKTKDIVTKRVKGLQTGNMNDIKILLDVETSNADLLEKCIHYVLDRYRCSNREFFSCNLSYIKKIVIMCCKFIDILKSSFHNITENELSCKLTNELEIRNYNTTNYYNNIIYNVSDLYDFNLWLDKNIIYKENGLLQVKDVCHLYLEKDNLHSSVSSKYKKEIEKYIKEKFTNLKWQYGVVKIGNTTFSGWKHLSIK